jgi:hypothetical protein
MISLPTEDVAARSCGEEEQATPVECRGEREGE